MQRQSHGRFFISATMLLMLFAACSREEKKTIPSFVTRWEVQPSFKYDLCCFIGIMTGREFYVRYYPKLYADWKKRLTPSARLALKSINEIIGVDTPPGPRLCLFLSSLPDEADSLSAIVHFVENSNPLPRASHDNAVDNQQWQALKPHLRIFLEFLQREKFESYWRAQLLPTINKQVSPFRQELQAFDVIGDLERFLVDENFSDTVYVHLVRLIQPHALRLPGQRYVSEASYPVHVTVKSAYHEFVHPYGDRLVDSVLAEQFKRLEQDSFLQLTVARIDQNTAYKSFRAFFHEEVAMAAELWVAERRRMISQITHSSGADPSGAVRRYLAEHDEGRHVLAAVIYSYLAEGLKQDEESYAEFLRMLFASRRLVPGKIEERYNKFMNEQ